jgi:quercetin dioxygenase-like cupin family protein
MRISLLALSLAAANFASPQTNTQANAQTAAPPVLVNNYAPPKDTTFLTSTSVDFDSLTARTNPNGQSRAVFDNPTATLPKFEVHVTTLLPGMSSHPIHRHVWEEIMLLRQGELDLSINGKPQHAGPGAFIFFAHNDPHNATNHGSQPATYYVVNFVTDAALADPNESAAEQAIPGKLASGVYDCTAQTSTPTPTGSRSVCVSSPTLTFAALESHITTLNPGQHTAAAMVDPGDEFVLIQSGDIEVTVNGISSRLHQGSMLYWAPNDRRSVRNIGPTPAAYQVIRVISTKSPKTAAR